MLASQKKRVFSRIAGWDIRPDVRKKASIQLELPIVEFDQGILHSDIVALAAPVHEIMKYLKRISQFPRRQLIFELGSTKSEVMKWVNDQHPDFRFVGGHPFTGTEKPGSAGWDERLFENRPFFLCPRKNGTSSLADLKIVCKILMKLGASPLEVDPVVHDCVLAYTSHLPYFVAASLVKTAFRNSTILNLHFVGSGFSDTTRLALSSPEMIEGIVRTNRENILDALQAFEHQLRTIKNLIYRSEWSRLVKELRAIQRMKQGTSL